MTHIVVIYGQVAEVNTGKEHVAVTEEGQEGTADSERLRRDMEFAEREDIVGEVEAEASNATGGEIDPTVVDVFEETELVRLGLRTLLRRLMDHLGRDEVNRAYEVEFGSLPRGSVNPKRLPTLGELRESRGYSMREFARLTGSSTRALQDAESGARAPRAETMHKYAKALGRHPWEVREFARWLLGEGKQEDEQKEESDE
jgi:DNA-binding XRE family transcriptional regulator